MLWMFSTPHTPHFSCFLWCWDGTQGFHWVTAPAHVLNCKEPCLETGKTGAGRWHSQEIICCVGVRTRVQAPAPTWKLVEHVHACACVYVCACAHVHVCMCVRSSYSGVEGGRDFHSHIWTCIHTNTIHTKDGGIFVCLADWLCFSRQGFPVGAGYVKMFLKWLRWAVNVAVVDHTRGLHKRKKIWFKMTMLRLRMQLMDPGLLPRTWIQPPVS